MDFNLPPVGGTDRTGGAPRAAGPKGSDFSAALRSATAGVDSIPPAPPAEVLEQMYDAALVADKLHAMNREVHFEPHGEGRVAIQVRDLGGNVVRTVAPSEALEIAAGAPID
jgi:hypothetical protein